MCFANAGKHFAYAVQVLLQRKMSVPAESLKVQQAFFGGQQPFIDKRIGLFQQEGFTKQPGIDRVQSGLQPAQGFLPALVVLSAGKQAVDAGLPGLFMLQQIISDAAVKPSSILPASPINIFAG